MIQRFLISFIPLWWVSLLHGQDTTQGFLSPARPEAPGTLLSHPVDNGSEPIGRTTSITALRL